jgi:NADH dehydrogenase FAD-containing subunit
MEVTNKESGTGKHVVVVGAGYAGLRAALGLYPQVQVTLIEPADHFPRAARLISGAN